MVLKLRDQGHHVKVLCYHPIYPGWKVNPSEEQIDGIEIVRMGKYVRFTKKQFLIRAILEITYALNCLFRIKKIAKDIDIIIPVFPPSLAFYLLLKRIPKSVQKVGMVHDLQEIYSKESKGFIYKLISNLINRVERKCYQSCDKIIFLSSEMKDKAQSLYHLHSQKLLVQFPFITIKENDTNDLNYIFTPNKIHVTYSGALGEKQNPWKLYDFFEAASNQIENLELHIFSQGDIFEQLKKANSNKQIHFHPLVSKENIWELYQKSHVQIVPQKEGTSIGSLPSKLPNLLVSNVKIFLITDPGSELERFFSNHQLSRVETKWDTEKLVSSLKDFLATQVDYSHQSDIANEFFTIDQMVHKILE
ncbi:MAG: hypothetical protein CMB99_10820 [Flavobacteriaceae bacterium]|nr:hypothetical protein [Flavobacteriaceae bacterium]